MYKRICNKQLPFNTSQVDSDSSEADCPINIFKWRNYELTPKIQPEIMLRLNNKILWEQFSKLTTEMVITKKGRCMFPSIDINIVGMDDRLLYCVFLEMALASAHRQKYASFSEKRSEKNKKTFFGAGWTSSGYVDSQPDIANRIYMHPSSPAPGYVWMHDAVTFRKLKLSNDSNTAGQNIILKSMHKYIPRIWIFPYNKLPSLHDLYEYSSTNCFTFKETIFIAVTAYQNETLKKLKIYENPFAKAFRKNYEQKHNKRMVDHLTGKEESRRSTNKSMNIILRKDEQESGFIGIEDENFLEDMKTVLVKNEDSNQSKFYRPWLSACS